MSPKDSGNPYSEKQFMKMFKRLRTERIFKVTFKDGKVDYKKGIIEEVKLTPLFFNCFERSRLVMGERILLGTTDVKEAKKMLLEDDESAGLIAIVHQALIFFYELDAEPDSKMEKKLEDINRFICIFQGKEGIVTLKKYWASVFEAVEKSGSAVQTKLDIEKEGVDGNPKG